MSFGTAFKAFFAILGDGKKGEIFEQACAGALTDKSELSELEKAKSNLEAKAQEDTKKIADLQAAIKEAKSAKDRSDAVYTLALLQREGRLIDFLKEDIGPYADEQVGAAVRQIHEGCGKVLEKYFKVEALMDVAEGESVDVPKDYDPSSFSLSGDTSGKGPYKGSLVHKGWKSVDLSLPERSKDLDKTIICPAEIDL